MTIESKTLIIGYGNPDRQDDGVAWHVLQGVAKALGIDQLDAEYPDIADPTGKVHLRYLLQLVPELAEELVKYDKVCFIDAHTAEISEEIRVVELIPIYKSSPFTHHLTPETLLEISRTIYNANPLTLLVSIKGYEFNFSNLLSERTANLIPEAVQIILDWVNPKK